MSVLEIRDLHATVETDAGEIPILNGVTLTVRTGEIFGYDTWIRVTVGTPEQNRRFIAALQKTVAEG